MKTQRFTVMKQCMVALGIVLNILGAFIALNLRLPIYLDSVGTVFVSGLLGPVYGMVTGALGSFVSGITFDIYSLYYAPAQLLTGWMAGIMFRTKWLSGKRLFIGNMAISIPTAIASAVMTAAVFGGVTSSGSSYLVILMNNLGMDLTLSCLIVQFITDYADELTAVCIVTVLLKLLTPELKARISGGRYGTL